MRAHAGCLAILLLAGACSSSSSDDTQPPPSSPAVAKACADTEEAFLQAAVRCGANYDATKAEFEKDIGGGCANIIGIRDEATLRSTCLPAYAKISCPDLTAGRLDPTCQHQFVRFK